jgi:hypothetical protein
LQRTNHFCDCSINFISAQIKYAFCVANTCADCALRLPARRGNVAAKKRLSPNYSDTFSEEILIFKDWAAAAKASARKICDSMCRRRE